MFNNQVAESKDGHPVPVTNFANAQCKSESRLHKLGTLLTTP